MIVLLSFLLRVSALTVRIDHSGGGGFVNHINKPNNGLNTVIRYRNNIINIFSSHSLSCLFYSCFFHGLVDSTVRKFADRRRKGNSGTNWEQTTSDRPTPITNRRTQTHILSLPTSSLSHTHPPHPPMFESELDSSARVEEWQSTKVSQQKTNKQQDKDQIECLTHRVYIVSLYTRSFSGASA